jgi:hypothetical protein
MIIARTKTGFQLTLNAQAFDKFNDNIGYLSLDLFRFQEWYEHKGEYEKEKALEASQDLIDIFIRLLGNTIISDSNPLEQWQLRPVDQTLGDRRSEVSIPSRLVQ